MLGFRIIFEFIALAHQQADDEELSKTIFLPAFPRIICTAEQTWCRFLHILIPFDLGST